jgi:hypothetical protein
MLALIESKTHDLAVIFALSYNVLLMLVVKFYLLRLFFHQEDNKVIHLVQEYGPKRWTLISKHLKGRTGKQCRER